MMTKIIAYILIAVFSVENTAWAGVPDKLAPRSIFQEEGTVPFSAGVAENGELEGFDLSKPIRGGKDPSLYDGEDKIDRGLRELEDACTSGKVAETIERLIREKGHANILVIGPGRGKTIYDLLSVYGSSVSVYSLGKHDFLYSSEKLAGVTGKDETKMRLFAALMRKYFTKHDADTGLPYGDESFDVVIMEQRTVPFFYDQAFIINEMLRVTKEGGVMFADLSGLPIETSRFTKKGMAFLQGEGFVFFTTGGFYAMLTKDQRDKRISLERKGYVLELSPDGEDDLTYVGYRITEGKDTGEELLLRSA